MKYFSAACILSVLCVVNIATAQSTKFNNDPDADFKLAKELYQQNKFSLAYPLFNTLYATGLDKSNVPVTVQLEVEYYKIICALELNEETAETNAREFIGLEHSEPRIEMVCFHLAEHYYRRHDFDNAIEYYEKCKPDNLSEEEIGLQKFHEGYAYFAQQRFDDAKPLFDAVRQEESDQNYYKANYYYGYIAFSNQDYKQALASFTIIENQEEYKSIIPYYITEIYYYTNQKDKALEYGLKELSSGNQYYTLELSQLVGHIYFEKGNYTKALPYLEKYVNSTEKITREDLYELSYCYYNAGQYAKATNGFKELGGRQDTLAQNSMYLLADSYLKLNNKNSARNAFLFCELNSSNAVQKEISQFNYAKLSYELGYTDVALNELRSFTATYPKSEYSGEAKELLLNVLANTNNYKEALDLLQSLSEKTETVQRIYPKVLYGRSVELINDQRIEEAETLLNKIYILNYNSAQIPYADFWKGEITFRNNKYDSAIYYLQNYLKNPVSYGEVSVQHAYYTLGYSYLRQENYDDAENYFEKITTTINASSSTAETDAYLREADCYYMQKQFSKALQMYNNVLNNNLPSADYALYQKAVIAGANDQLAQKVSLLQSLQQRYPSSAFNADASMEIANTYLANEQYQQAIAPLNTIIKNDNATAFKPQAYLELGISYYNLKNNDEALNNFQKLITDYPNSNESNEAVNYVRDIFIDNGKPEAFVAFMHNSGKEVSTGEQDSLTYITAGNAYQNKAYTDAANGFAAYLNKFPEGRYAVDADFYLAEIYYTKKDYGNALQYYDAVAQKAPNSFAEKSLLQAARITYFELLDYKKAEQYFEQLKTYATTPENKLESMRGLLRCQYKLNEFNDALSNAQDLLQQKGIATDDKLIANMIIAKNNQQNNLLPDATTAYKNVISYGKSEYAAEARYRVAEILVIDNRLQDAEKAAFDVINKAGSYDYWITEAYILLGDIYYKEQDYFNAEATLKSVVENAPSTELKQEAQRKLDMVLADKNKNSKVTDNNN